MHSDLNFNTPSSMQFTGNSGDQQTEAIIFGRKVRSIKANLCGGDSGVLIPIELDGLPFYPKRVFFIRDVPSGTVRGQHAHRSDRQILFCLNGAIKVTTCYNDETLVKVLDQPNCGLLIEPGVWSSQEYLLSDSVLLVFSSARYDPDDYVNKI